MTSLFSPNFFLFFLLSIVTYYSIKIETIQNIILLGLGFFFVFSDDNNFINLAIFSIGLNFGFALLLENLKKHALRLAIMLASLAANLAIIILWREQKYMVSQLGISFIIFQNISILVETYKRRLKLEKDPLVYLLNFFCLWKPISGPLENCLTFTQQFKKVRAFVSFDSLFFGLFLFVQGIFKKWVAANSLQILGLSAPARVNSILFNILQLYFELSAFSDIARGSGFIFGIKISRNMQNPLLAKSLPDFWTRFHISLSLWFKQYLFLPIYSFLEQKKIFPQISILLGWLAIGLWHGTSRFYLFYALIQSLGHYLHYSANTTRTPKSPWINRSILYGSIGLSVVLFSQALLQTSSIPLFSLSDFFNDALDLKWFFPFLFLALILEVIDEFFGEKWILQIPTLFQIIILSIYIFLIVSLGILTQNQFIYAQF